MPEGLLTAGGIAAGVHDDPDRPPEPSAEAPRGWTMDRRSKTWKPRQRGPVLFRGDAGSAPDGDGPGDTDAGARAEGGNQRDPDPAWLRDDTEPGKADDGKIAFADVPKEVKDDIAGLAGLVGTPILAMLQQIDPYCGTILAQSYEGIIDATLPLICRSKKIVKYFSAEDQTDWLLWGKLALALKPFAQAVIQHHVLKTVQLVEDAEGQIYPVKVSRGQTEHGDGLTPQPQPEYSYQA